MRLFGVVTSATKFKVNQNKTECAIQSFLMVTKEVGHKGSILLQLGCKDHWPSDKTINSNVVSLTACVCTTSKAATMETNISRKF